MTDSDWTRIHLGAACTKIGSGATPRGGSESYLADGPYALIRSQNVYNDGFRRDGLAFISERQAEGLSNVAVEAHDVLLNITGDSVARCCQVDTAILPARVNQHVAIIRPDPKKLDACFLRYALVSPEMQARMLSWAGAGGTRNALTKSMIEAFELLAPVDVHEQQAVGQVLGALDEKIEMNRGMSETLEEMARAQFKSWFVEFEPVRAKIEGRDPGLPKEIADLFPSSFENSELGEIPKGWRASKLGTETRTVLGGTPSRAESSYWGGDVPWINSGKANEFRVVEPSEFITREGLASSATKLLPSRTTIIAITGATLGQISLTEIETCANQSIVGVLGTDHLPSEYIYFWTKEHVQDLVAWQTGGAQQHINKNNVNALPVVCPSERVTAAYLAVVRPFFDRISACCHESLSLAVVRNSVLPKLIAGGIRVPHHLIPQIA